MKRTIVYLIFVLIFLTICGFQLAVKRPNWMPESFLLGSYCGIFGGIGGVLYCLRGVYLNACVRKSWENLWLPWYFIRPVVSIISGVASYLFLRAGLILLEAKSKSDATDFAFYTLAFIAGLNVDKFIERIEEIAASTWGIKKTRASSGQDEDNKNKSTSIKSGE